MTAARPIHLDTDLGGDTDDLCALAWVLRRPDIDLIGITTNSDPGGARVGLIDHVLRLVGREDVPVAAGADESMSGFKMTVGLHDAARYWGGPIASRPGAVGAGLELLANSIERGATVVAIGVMTNFAMLEILQPGALARADIVLMGGTFLPPPVGFPAWGFEMDYNLLQDVRASEIVFERSDPLVIPIEMSIQMPLTARDATRLESGDSLAKLLARQALEYRDDNAFGELAQQHAGLPDDLLNFQHDALACMAALEVPGITIERVPLGWTTTEDGYFRLRVEEGGKPIRVVTKIDVDRLTTSWLQTVLSET